MREVTKGGRRGLLMVSVAVAAFVGAFLPQRQAAAFEFLVTPWTSSSSSEMRMTCTNCGLAGYSPTLKPIYLTHAAKGTYQVRFTGTPYSASTKIAAHVTALGVPGASCMPYYLVRSGTDYFMNISCTRAGADIDSRLMVDLTTGSGSWVGEGRGTGVVVSNALTADSWSSSGQTPTLSHPSLGQYTVYFPGLNDQKSGGNAQATSTSYGKHCSLTSWGTNGAGSSASVACYDANDNLVDSNVMVTYEQQSGPGQNSKGFVWTDQPSYNGTYTPNTTYNRGVFKEGGVGASSSMKVTRLAKGNYLVDVGAYRTGSINSGVHAQVTPWGTAATCNVVDLDVYSVNVTCSDRSGNNVDAYFSLLYYADNTYFTRGFYQVPVNGTNYNATFDVGQGLACGTSPTQAGVICVTPSGRSATSDVRQVGGGVPPSTAKSVAVAGVDASATTVLALGSDNIVYQTKGNLGPNWNPGTNFTSWSILRRPTDVNGSAVSLKKIVAVRSTNAWGAASLIIAGLTTGGKVMITNSVGDPWAPYTVTFDANATFLDISHGRDDLYAIRSDNVMVTRSFSGSWRTLPALPNGYLPIAIGGRYAMTNAGKSGASYPCTTPKNQWGYYNCPGALKRIYRLMVDNTWMQMQEAPFTQQFEPTQNQTDVLSDGDPLASTRPTIIDGDAFEGNFGAPFVWQYFSRIYQLNQ